MQQYIPTIPAIARYLVCTALTIVGLIHLLPLSGVLGVERLATLYGVACAEPSLAILMRHRAVLFGLLGLFMLYAAFNPALQPLALAGGFVSVASFLWLAYTTKGYNPQVARVFSIDIAALACLLVGALAHWFTRNNNFIVRMQ